MCAQLTHILMGAGQSGPLLDFPNTIYVLKEDEEIAVYLQDYRMSERERTPDISGFQFIFSKDGGLYE